MIIKNRFGNKTIGIEDILKSLWQEFIHLFHYTILLVPLIVTLFSIFHRME